jgi:hypothetical protein
MVTVMVRERTIPTFVAQLPVTQSTALPPVAALTEAGHVQTMALTAAVEPGRTAWATVLAPAVSLGLAMRCWAPARAAFASAIA